jgi:hypothetical protein
MTATGPSGLLLPRRALGVADIDWVSALLQDAAPSAGFFARLAQADGVETAEPHLALTSIERIAEDPRLVDLAVFLAGGDLHVQAAPVGVPACLAFRTAADDSRSICLMPSPAAVSILVYIPLTYVYTRLRPVATEDTKVVIFA